MDNVQEKLDKARDKVNPLRHAVSCYDAAIELLEVSKSIFPARGPADMHIMVKQYKPPHRDQTVLVASPEFRAALKQIVVDEANRLLECSAQLLNGATLEGMDPDAQ